MSALLPGDHAHAQSPAFQRRVTAALACIGEAAKHGRVGVSVSGGKDSTVLLDLVRTVVPDAPGAFFDSGLEYPETYEFINSMGVVVIQPQRLLLDMLKEGGYWGHAADANAPRFDFFDFLVGEPAARFAHQEQLAVAALGLRAQESAGRQMKTKVSGTLYYVRSEGLYHLCPLALWRVEDVWAYIAFRRLAYNTIYDRMADISVPRPSQRVSILISSMSARWGALARLRQLHPGLFNTLAAQFPRLMEFC